ncbi:hypothetical protein I6F35_03220 [Bradyrhizobium sp. BRP22]|uniref:hypothetical protein n=1 Tax=Bradyrhizobium sp. BRP22 TaxID=2793821 RepID=UPI001CD1D757|nr:hypothetical protein [Bradyrhizobium sp. BRP22]MCA1452227.1 hypothetical protein [Bradyrhizobium sp. BRP22]
MSVHKIAAFSVTTDCAEPLRGIVEIDMAGTTLRFELNEELAHILCSDLDQFLAQAQQRALNKI